MLGAALNNAKKSNGVLWTVLMMHPQTVFRCHSSYVEWLDDFRAECGELEDYEVRFIHFQDLVALSATAAAGGGGETTGNTD